MRVCRSRFRKLLSVGQVFPHPRPRAHEPTSRVGLDDYEAVRSSERGRNPTTIQTRLMSLRQLIVHPHPVE